MAFWWRSRRVLTARDRWTVFVIGVAVVSLGSVVAISTIRLIGGWFTGTGLVIKTYLERLREPEETLAAQLAACSAERASLATQVASLEVAKRENEQAAGLFSRPRTEAWQETLGRVVAMASKTSSWEARLDIGATDGLLVGQPVLGASGGLLGLIDKVSDKASVVRYLNAESSKIAVSLASSRTTIGLLEGTNGESLVVKYISRNQTLTVGDLLVTASSSEQIPFGIPVAVVREVVDVQNQPFLTAVVEALEDPLTTTLVTVRILPSL